MVDLFVINKIYTKFGKNIRLPSDFVELSNDIHKKTGELISVNTLKRLLGNINEQRKPRLATLDIIAKYLDSENWDDLVSQNNQFYSSGFMNEYIINFDCWQKNDSIRLKYLPDRKLLLKFLGGSDFEVISSLNSQLISGDILKIKSITIGRQLFINDVFRNGISLGKYQAGVVDWVNPKRKKNN